MKYPFLILLIVFLPILASADADGLLIDDFEQGLRPTWEEKAFKGRTDYRVVPDGSGHCLQARSRNAASGLIFRREVDLKEFSVLSWRWKVGNILEKGDARKKTGDDYAGRVYVVFPHWFPPKTRSINYIWGNRLPKGEIVPNPFTSNAMMVAVESGEENVGEWVTERRDVYADYRAIFGEEPPLAGAVAIMTDTDNTGEATVAWYDDFRLEKR